MSANVAGIPTLLSGFQLVNENGTLWSRYQYRTVACSAVPSGTRIVFLAVRRVGYLADGLQGLALSGTFLLPVQYRLNGDRSASGSAPHVTIILPSVDRARPDSEVKGR